MLRFPRKEEGKKEKKRKEGEKKGKKGREEEERKRERNVKGQNGLVYWERRRKFVKRNEGVWLATRKKNIFWAMLCSSLDDKCHIIIICETYLLCTLQFFPRDSNFADFIRCASRLCSLYATTSKLWFKNGGKFAI